MSFCIAVPAGSIKFVDLPPMNTVALPTPSNVVIESPSSKLSTGVIAALMNIALVVGNIQVAIADETIDQHQIVRLITRVDHRPRQRNRRVRTRNWPRDKQRT